MRKIATVAAGVLLCAGLAAAQALPAYVDVWVPGVSPEKTADFERVVKRFIEAYNKVKSTEHWVVAQRFYGDKTAYVFFIERQKWAELDSAPQDLEVLTKAYGRAEAERFMKQASGTFKDAQAYFLRVRGDLSLRPDRQYPARSKVLRASAYWVRPGRGPDFEALLKRAIEAHTQLGTTAHFTLSQTVSGGGPNYWLTTFAPNFAEFDNDPGNVILKAFGQEEYDKFRMKAAEVVEKAENYTHVLRPDLSRAPQSYVEANKAMWAPKPAPKPAEEKKPAEKKPAEKKS